MPGMTIEMHRLGKRYGEDGDEGALWAVRRVTLYIYAGQVTVLMGPSGSGKTTLLSMLGGLLAPTEGWLTVCGQALDGCDESLREEFRRRCVGYVFQNCNLLAALTAEENLRVALSLRGEDEGHAADLLAAVGLREKAHAYPEELSGGQRQRVAIARALAGGPPVLLADEPTAALDAENGRQVMALLRKRAHEAGTTVVVVTHDPRVREFSDRVIEMEDGQLSRIVRRLRKTVFHGGSRPCAAHFSQLMHHGGTETRRKAGLDS